MKVTMKQAEEYKKARVVNSNNEEMTKPQINLTIPKNHDQRMYKFGYDTARNEILEFIKNERDNGNVLNGFKDKMDGFSASLCLSNLMKYLNKHCSICSSDKHTIEEHTDKLMFKEGCGKRICETPDVLVCGEDEDLYRQIIYCDECLKKRKRNNDKI